MKKNVLSSTVMVLVWWYAEPSLISCVLFLEDSPGGGIRYCNIGEADSIHNLVWALRVVEELLLTIDKLP